MKNWLEIGVGVYLLGMILYGHYRGAVRLAVSMVSLMASLLAAHLAMPYVADFVRDNTPFQTWVTEQVCEALKIDELKSKLPSAAPTEAKRQFIEDLALPDQWKELLIENDNIDVYQKLDVDAFAEYLGSLLADAIIRSAGFVILFILFYVLLKVLAGVLDVVARLPVLSGVNQLAGALLGGIEALFFLWLAFLALSAFSAFPWAESLLAQIEASPWLSFLYRYNFVSRLALGIAKGKIFLPVRLQSE